MNAQVMMKFNNKYHIELIDSITGKVKQSGDFHNIATKNLCHILTGYIGESATALGPVANMMASLDVGSGTTEPSYGNTALANLLWNVTAENKTFEWIDDYTGKGTATYTYPATSSYVGTVTEVGLKNQYHTSSYGTSYNYSLCTRALLTDSEGQPISFNKTDTDILIITVTVELTLNSMNDAFKIFKHPFFIRYILNGGATADPYLSSGWGTIHGAMNLCRFDYDLQNFQPYDDTLSSSQLGSRIVDKPVSYNNIIGFFDEASAYVSYDVARLLSTSVPNETYFKAVAIPSIGYWELPNESIFPAYTIAGISIGTGDGATSMFENPINYFKEGTEKIYKNGVQLTRDVDYTINNKCNKDCLPEVAQMSLVSKVYSNVNLASYQLQVYPLCIPTAHVAGSYVGFKSANQYDVTSKSPAFNASNPLYIEYEEEVTLNCFKCTGGLKTISAPSGYSNLPVGSTFYLDYSEDGEEYIEVGSAVTTVANGVFTLDFNDTTAKYWRIRTLTTGMVAMPRDDNYENFITLNRKDPYINFATAPAEGDILTMDVDMDIIMKNSNFVVDVGCRLDFSI